MVSSFNHAYIKQVKKLNPRITTGALVDKPLNNPANYLKEIEADVYDVSVSAISLDEIELLQSKGFSVIIWTVNDEKTMKDLIKVRVDGVITDFPQKLKTILDPGPRQ